MNVGNTILLFAPFLPLLSGGGAGRLVSLISLGVVLFFLIVKAFNGIKYKVFLLQILTFFSIIFVGLFSAWVVSGQTVVQIIQFLIIGIVLLVCPGVFYTDRGAKVGFWICFALIFVSIIDFLQGFNFIAPNPNLYGIAGFVWAAAMLKFWDKQDKSKLVLYLLLVFPLFLIVASGSRSSLFAFVMMIILGEVLRFKNFSLYKNILIFLIIAAPIYLVFNVDADFFSSAGEWVPQISEKKALSHRDTIWGNVIGAVNNNGYVGFGVGSTPGGVQDSDFSGYSAHNGFVQIYYQFGIIGLGLYLIFLLGVLTRIKSVDTSGYGLIMLVGGLLIDMFEVVMVQNHFGTGTLIWILSTIGICSRLKSEAR